MTDEMTTTTDGPVHLAFGFTYASYLVWPRSLMEHMPLEWQRQFVALSDAFWAEWDARKTDCDYEVRKRDDHGRYAHDPLGEYRRPDRQLIDSMRLAADRPDENGG